MTKKPKIKRSDTQITQKCSDLFTGIKTICQCTETPCRGRPCACPLLVGLPAFGGSALKLISCFIISLGIMEILSENKMVKHMEYTSMFCLACRGTTCCALLNGSSYSKRTYICNQTNGIKKYESI